MALSYNAHDYINSSTFWAQLEPLRELLQPIDEALRMSESNRAHLEKVLDRWAKIHTHLIRMKNDFPVLGEFLQQNGTFSTRYHRQEFSIQILIHDKKRNRLASEKVDKLTYIYMNTRVLVDVDKRQTKPLHALTEEEKVELEDKILQEDDSSDNSKDEATADELEEDSSPEGNVDEEFADA